MRNGANMDQRFSVCLGGDFESELQISHILHFFFFSIGSQSSLNAPRMYFGTSLKTIKGTLNQTLTTLAHRERKKKGLKSFRGSPKEGMW